MSPGKIPVLSATSTNENETQLTLLNCDRNRVFASFHKHEICYSNISREPYSTWFLVRILIRLRDTSSWFCICETADRYERYISLDAKHNLLLRLQEPLLKARTPPSNFSFKSVHVSLNCFRPCQIDLAFRDSVPFVTSKNTLKSNNGLELGKSHDALCRLLNERRHTDCKN